MMHDKEDRYGLIARLFHWSTAVLIFGLIGLGWYMVGLSYYDPLYHDSLSWHKALGMILLLLVILRLAWTFATPRPRPSPDLSMTEEIASAIVHAALRVALVVIPVSGYLMSTAAGDPVSVFGWFDIPALVSIPDGWRDVVNGVHVFAAYGTGAVALLHAAAALKHRFVDKDGVLGRML